MTAAAKTLEGISRFTADGRASLLDPSLSDMVNGGDLHFVTVPADDSAGNADGPMTSVLILLSGFAPGTYFVEDDGIAGNGIAQLRQPDGGIIAFGIPTEFLTVTASAGRSVVFNLTEWGAANINVGNLTDAAQNPDSIAVRAINGTTGAVTLVSNGAITELGSDAAPDIVAGTLILSAATGVGTAGNAIETQIAQLEAETATGGINISNFGNVTIGGLTADVDGLDVLTSGNLVFTAVGSIVLNDDTGFESVHGGNSSGDVTLIASGFDSDISSIIDQDSIAAPGGSIFLTAGRDIAFGTLGLNFDNDVRARGGITVNAGRDVLIDGFADLAADGFGAGTGGNAVINAGRNIGVLNATGTDGSVGAEGSAGADLILTTGPGGTLTVNASSTAVLFSSSGDVIINTDRMIVGAAGGITANAGQVSIQARTSGRGIDLGSAGDAASAIELSNAELNRIFTSNLRIGSADAGAVTVSAAVNLATTANVVLQSGTDIFLNASLTAPTSLSLLAADSVFQLAASTLTAPTVTVSGDVGNTDPGFGASVTMNGAIAGTNTLNGNDDADSISGTGQANFINGLGGNDTLRGNGGNDTIDGGTGADTMAGGLGDDNYFVDNAGDVVTETAGQGNDRIFASVSYVLAAGTSIETLSTTDGAGTSAINLTGNELANTLIGNAGANVLTGGGGADTLIGLGGNDTLVGNAGAASALQGGTGDDFYFVNNAGDSVIEFAGEGTDRVFSSVSFTLSAGRAVESLETASQAGTGAINLTGNELAQTIFGNAGNNILTGGGGADTIIGFGGDDQLFGNADAPSSLQGGTGDDTYFISLTGDSLVEFEGEGNDRILTSVSYTMSNNQEIETLAVANQAGATAIDLAGNVYGQLILGNQGVNTLSGGGGDDVVAGLGGADILLGGDGADQLNGGTGSDVLNGGAGADIFIFADALGAGNIDGIQDFVTGQDRLFLENAVFAGLPAGVLAVGALVNGSVAQDADDRILYDPATGALFFDPDGTGAAAAVQFATLVPGTALAASDIVVI